METNNKEYKDVSKKSLAFKAKRSNNVMIKQTLSSLKSAITQAKSIDFPNRYYLLNIYNDIVSNDSHLSALIKHRKTSVTGLKFKLVKTNGKEDEKANALFNQIWFERFVEYVLDAIFFGNSLIEINTQKGDINVILLDRCHVIPEFKEYKANPYSTTGEYVYSEPIYAKDLIDVNNNYDKRNLGELLSVSESVLMKGETKLNWSEHIEIYGQPIRMATVDTQNPEEQQQAFQFLEELGRSGYVVKDSKTLIEFVESDGKSSSSELYKDFVTFLNEEMSKKIVGGTMLTDSGSSRSQSEVHERGSYKFTKSDIKFVTNIINFELIPMLQSKGIINTKGLTFEYIEPDVLTAQDKAIIEQTKTETDRFLIDNFKVKDINYFIDRYNTELEFIDTEENSSDEEDSMDLKEELQFATKSNKRYNINLKLKDE